MINENIKVSVIMPAYNDGIFIKDTILSVLNQSHKNIELIVVDDHSQDDTVEIINSLNDHRIKLIVNSENKGAAYSRNTALLQATGEYVAFLDGDDRWDEKKIEKQLNFMVKNNYTFTYTNYYSYNYSLKNNSKRITGPQVVTLKKLLRCDYIGCLTVMYKRDIIPTLQIPIDIKKRNDYAMWLIIAKATPCYLLDEYLAFYTENPNGISNISKIKLIKYHYYLFRHLLTLSKIKAAYYSLRNAFYYILKKVRYIKKYR